MLTSRVISAAVRLVSTLLCFALVVASHAAGVAPPPSNGGKGKAAALPVQSGSSSAVADFSPTLNPNGAWSYGYRATPVTDSQLTLYPSHANIFGSGLESWSRGDGTCCPMVTRNATGSTLTYPNNPTVVQPADVLNLHPGGNGERSVVRWTAPSAGTVTIQGRFQGIDTAGTTTDFIIFSNAALTPTLLQGVVKYAGDTTKFSVGRVVAAGEVIEFSVGYGNETGPNATNDSTGLAVTITYGTPSPQTTGQWGPLLDWKEIAGQVPNPVQSGNLPPVAVHSTLLPNGNVLMWSRDRFGPALTGTDFLDSTPGARIWQPAAVTGEPGVIDPAQPGSFIATVGHPSTNLFCASHALLPDGRLLAAGGHHGEDGYGESHTNVFDWRNNTWTRGPDMGPLNSMGRWYPNVTTLADGDAVIAGGNYRDISGLSPATRDNQIAQVWHSTGATGTLRNLSERFVVPLSRMHLAPDGRVFFSGPTRTTLFLNTAAPGTWTDGPTSGPTPTPTPAASPAPSPTPPPSDRWNGSSVMYDVGKVLIMGGGQEVNDLQKRPLNTAETIDLNVPNPTWQPTSPMNYRREFINATSLADGKVLVTGGSSGVGNDDKLAAMAAEMWDPATGQWTVMATMLSYRGYHTTALLLPDGKVLVAGSGQPPYDTARLGTNAQIFSPPYLFNGPRPVIKSAPNSVNYNQTFFVETDDPSSISKVTLVRLGSVTHAFDSNQRFNRLNFAAGIGGVSVTSPANGNVCPPGHYMLFILNANGVPSVSKVISVDPNTPAVPSAPTSLSAAANSAPQVDVTWGASTGNVHHYEVQRAPTRTGPYSVVGSNSPGSPFNDTTALPGVAYVYRVRAVDPSGNFSDFSNLDLATTVLFTNNPLAAGVPIRSEHMTQLRQAVNAVRAAAGLAAAGWTDSAAPGTPVRAVHIQELRTALAPALALFGLTFGPYADPTLTPNSTPVRAVHWQEIRDRVK